MPNTITLHRILKATPEKVYRAFTEANALASWIPPYGFLCTIHEMNVEIEGTFRMSFQNFTTGNTHSFGGKYLVVDPGKSLKYTDAFDDPNLPGEMTTSVSFSKVLVGTEIRIVQENIPDVIPPEMCYLGWQESLDKLTRLVEPEIRD